MSRILLVGRLALRDLRRRRTEAGLLLLVLTAATTTLTLGLVLRDAASDPYQSTRAATNGPDVVANADGSAGLAGLEDLAGAPEVIDHTGPFPVVAAELGTAGRTSDVQVVGRDPAPARVDQPELVQGSWVRDGGVVVEAAFAAALGIAAGDQITLDGQRYEVAGVAVTAAMPPYPAASCLVSVGCLIGTPPEDAGFEVPPDLVRNPGLVWVTQAELRNLAADPASLSYVLNLRLADPDAADAFAERNLVPSASAPRLASWQGFQAETTALARDTQILLLFGAWLLGLLAAASVAVLVGGRMADQTRRVGLLKAVGGTPSLVAAVLLAEYAVVATAAAAVGLVAGTLAAPLLTAPSAGLIGSAGPPALTVSTVVLVSAVALGVAAFATFVPAVRAARTSTVHALADSARRPRRVGWLIAVSARLPVPLLLALRVAARRPRRAVLSVASIAITISGLVVALILHTFLSGEQAASEYERAHIALLGRVLLIVMAVLLALAAVNAVFITWATVLDNRHSSALARALGATPRQVSAALAAAQVLPALAGAVLGVFPGGFALFHAINAITGGGSDRPPFPPFWQLLALALSAVLAVAVLTAVPARLGGRRPVARTLHAELA